MHFLKDKIVWVIGASSGIGEEIAIQAAQQGASVILSARNHSALNNVQATLKDSTKHLCLPIDLEDSSTFKSAVDQVIEKYNRIDYLFNNGGLSQRSTVAETPMEVDRRIMEINYFGNIALTKAVLPHFIQQKSGHVVVISSIAGKFGFFLRSAYSASKHALVGFYESLLLEEAKNNIHITLAFPGKINTAISMHALNAKGEQHGIMDHNQATGMPVETCVNQLLIAVQKNKKEVLIGNKEILAVKIKRFFPKLFWRIIRKQSAV
jgi:dehydrogenase/reductase SDR family protein 7B